MEFINELIQELLYRKENMSLQLTDACAAANRVKFL